MRRFEAPAAAAAAVATATITIDEDQGPRETSMDESSQGQAAAADPKVEEKVRRGVRTRKHAAHVGTGPKKSGVTKATRGKGGKGSRAPKRGGAKGRKY